MADQVTNPQAAAGGDVGFFDALADSPPVLRDYLLSADITKRRDHAYTRFGLSEKERAAALFAELDLFFDQIDPEDFLNRLAEALPERAKDEERMRQLAVEVLGRVVLPAEAFVGDVAGAIRALGGDPASFPAVPLAVRAMSYQEGAEEVASHLPFLPTQPDARRRIMNAIESRLRNVRTDNDTLDILTRSRKTGGAEMPIDDARRVVAEIAARSRTMTLEEGVPAAPVAPKDAAGAPAKAGQQVTAAEVLRRYAGTTEEQAEIVRRIERIRKVTGNDSAKMRDAFFEVLYPPQKEGEPPKQVDSLYVVAGLLAAAEDAELQDLLSEDDRFRGIVARYYASPEGEGRSEEIARFKEDPMNPAAMNVLLQLLLRGFARLSDEESARFCIRITNVLRRSGISALSRLAAFDMRAGGFRWADLLPLA